MLPSPYPPSPHVALAVFHARVACARSTLRLLPVCWYIGRKLISRLPFPVPLARVNRRRAVWVASLPTSDLAGPCFSHRAAGGCTPPVPFFLLFAPPSPATSRVPRGPRGPAPPCPALPCPALPCPALPCPAVLYLTPDRCYCLVANAGQICTGVACQNRRAVALDLLWSSYCFRRVVLVSCVPNVESMLPGLERLQLLSGVCGYAPVAT